MKKYSLLLLLIISGLVTIAQSKIDLPALATKADEWCIKNFDSATYYATIGLQQSIAQNNVKHTGYFKCILGKAAYFNGKYDSAANYYSQSIAILEKTNFIKELGYVYNEQAKLYRKLKKLDKAKDLYDEAMQCYQQIKDSAGIQMIYNESGVVYEYQENYPKALENYQLSLGYAEARNDKVGIAYSYNFIGIIYSLTDNYLKAKKYLDSSFAMHTSNKDTFAMGTLYLDIASMQMKFNKYQEAIGNTNLCIAIAAKMHFLDLRKDAYDLLAKIYKSNGDNSNAFLYLQKWTDLKDSIFNINTSKQIEELNVQYQVAKTENEKNKLQVSNNHKNILLLALIAFGLIASIWFYHYRQQQQLVFKNKLQQERIALQDSNTQAILEAEERERNRIGADLHDGLGQLITAAKMNLQAIDNKVQIIGETDYQLFKNAFALVEQSGADVRTISHNMMPNLLLRAGLGAAVKDFINKLNTKQLKVNLITEGLDTKIDHKIELVLYRIILECVNNVIKHAHATQLNLSLHNDADYVSITIEDNGVGFDTNQLKNNDGIGLDNIQTRVAFLQGQLDFDSAPGKGTFISIHIPKHNNEA